MLAQGWKVEKLSNKERVFEKIKSLPKPVAVIVFGVHGFHKNLVFNTFCEQLGADTKANELDPSFSARILEVKKSDDGVFVAHLPGRVSCERTGRLSLLQMFRDAGAGSVVGVYAKVAPDIEPDADPNNTQQLAVKNQMAFLIALPPVLDEGWDYLITVRET